MVLFGLVFVGLGIWAACYKKERIVPARETRTVKPLIVLILLGLGVVCLLGSSSDPKPKQPQATAVTPVRTSGWPKMTADSFKNNQ
jgi:hypothetical protein